MPAAKRTNPEILEMPDQNMAVVYTHGEPGPQMERVMPALFGSVFGLKFTLKKQGREMKVGCCAHDGRTRTRYRASGRASGACRFRRTSTDRLKRPDSGVEVER